MNHAHEVDVHHAPEQRRIGFCERRGFRSAGIGDQDIDRLPRRGFRDRGADGGLIGDVGHASEMRDARGNGLIQRRAIAAEHGDRRARARQRGRDLAADAAPAAGDERMRRNAAVRTCAASPNELIDVPCRAYILNFKAFARKG